MMLLAQPIEHGPLRIFTPREAPATVVLDGVIRDPDPASWFCPVIDQIHRRAVEDKPSVVTIDLRQLEHANAAAWKCFVYWVKLMADASYKLRILSDERHKWQQVGMSALRVFGGERLEIKIVRGAR
jgi:hypothetical protein